MRTLLVILLVNGLVPGLGEIAEAAVHVALEGHLPHSIADCGDLGDPGQEHGCGTTEHRCSCCTSLTFVVDDAGVVLPSTADRSSGPAVGSRLASRDAPAPPHRPPIAS